MLSKKEIKQRYFDKIYKEAKVVKCACGCGIDIKNKDKYGRDKLYVNGHNNRKYKDPLEYKKVWDRNHKDHKYKYKIKRGHRLKQKIINITGGQCEQCGLKYNGNNGCIFQLHHKNPFIKLFNINAGTLIRYSWKKILEELKKCQLLCANCHFMHHNEKY